MSTAPIIDRSVQSALANAPLIFWTVNTVGVVQIAIGKGMARQNLNTEKVVGRSIFELYKDYPEFIAAIRRALAGESVQLVLETFDGTFDRRLEPIRDERGAITGVVGISVDVTDQVYAQNALRLSEEQFRDLVEGSIQGIAIVQDGKIVFANEAAATIFGFPSTQAMRCDFDLEAFFDAAVVGEIRANVAKRIGGEPLPPYRQVQGRRFDGATLWLELMARAVNWSGGPALQVAFSDITARKTSELLLQRREEQYRDLLEGSLQGVVIRRARRNLFANDAMARMLGYERGEDLLPLENKDFMTQAEIARRDEAVAQRERGEPGPETFEVELLRKDGAKVICMAFRRSVQWEGEPAFQLTLTDITDRKQVEQALRESEWQLARAQEAAHIGTWYRDLGSELTRWSDEFYRLLGLKPGDIHASTDKFIEFVHPDDQDEYRNLRIRALELDGHFNVELRILRADGQTRRMRVVADRVDNEHGRPVALVGTLEDITDRRAAEDTLRTSEERYRDLVEGSLQGIAIVQDFHYVFANPAYARMFGFDSFADLKAAGSTLSRATPAERQRIQQYGLDRVAGKPVPVTYESEWIRKDGTVFQALGMHRIITWEGKPAILVTSFDVTDQRAAQEALRTSEQRYRDLVEGSVQGIAIVQDFKFQFANAAYLRMYGYGTFEALQAEGNTQERVAPYDRERLLGYAKARLAGLPAPAMYELDCLHRDGSVFTVLAMSRLIHWNERPASQITVIDVTEQRKLEKSLRLKDHAIQSANEAIAFGDLQGRFVEANPAFAKMWGLASRDEVIGRRAIEFWWTPEDLAQAVDAIRETGYWVGETVARRSNGETFPVDVRVSTVRDEKGAPVWLMASIVDITERKRTLDRHRELEEQLFQAQKMESIGRLVGGIAHDFNNMLTPMLGYAELVLATMDPADPSHRHVQVIRSAAERASDLTRKMLMFGRRRPLRKSRVDIGPEIQSVVDMLKRVIHETVIIDAQIDRDVGQIDADPTLIHQLVMNLALNARDAMPQGGALNIQARRTSLTPGSDRPTDLPPGPYVRISVQDTGHGMDAETVNRIFDPFFTTKPEGKGTGLGLSVVYGIVNQHGGQVTVNSKPGLGSTFIVYLPAPAIAPTPRKAVEHAALPPQAATILVVEDDPQVLGLVSAILGNQGYALLQANGPDEALRVIAAQQTPADLLLCDVVMPKMNGPTLAKQVTLRWPKTRVLFMSGYAKDVAEEHGLHEQSATLLDKPFSVDELSRAVRRALEHS